MQVYLIPHFVSNWFAEELKKYIVFNIIAQCKQAFGLFFG